MRAHHLSDLAWRLLSGMKMAARNRHFQAMDFFAHVIGGAAACGLQSCRFRVLVKKACQTLLRCWRASEAVQSEATLTW